MGPKVNVASSKRKHQTLTLFQKLEIVKKLENGVSRHTIMKEFDIGSSTIYDIKKNKDKLKEFVKESETLKNLTERQTLKKPKLDQLDSVLYTWFVAKRSEGKPITGPMVVEKAKQFQQDLNIDADCKFSEGWLRSFKSRHGIRKLDISGELKSANVVGAEEFKVKFKSIVSDNKLTACQIYNADETGLLWRCLPNSTLAGGDEKGVKGFKKNKDRLTVLLCSNSSDHKLKHFVIGKSKQPRALKGVKTLPVIYGSQSNAWMEKNLFKNWFFQDFVPAVKNNFKKLNMPEDSKAILFLDNCSAHPDEEELVSGNISVSYLPPNVTALIQPMDQGAIQNFKSHYRRYFVQNLIASDCNVKDFQGQFSVKDAIFASALAWGEVKQETLKKSWRKLWPEVMDEDIEAIYSDSDPPVDELEVVLSDLPLENPMSQMNREEIREWIGVDCDEQTEEIMTDETIIQSVLNPTAPKDIDSDEDDVDETNDITWNQAADALNTLIKFYERSNSFNDAEIMKLHIMRNDFIKKRREITKKQIDIRDMFKMASTKKKNPVDLDQPSCSTSK